MFGDPWPSRESLLAEQAARDEADRQARAQLLLARGHDRAAAVVATATYTADQVDNWDGGQYEVTLGVPAGAYDAASTELHDVLSSAAEAIVGAMHYRGLLVTVRRPGLAPGWEAGLLEVIADRGRGSGRTTQTQAQFEA